MALRERVHYTWDLSFGNVLTVGTGALAFVGLWFTQVDKIDDNREKLTLHEMRMDRMEEKFRSDLEAAERRILAGIEDMKSDIRWLVRSTTERKWLEDELERKADKDE